MTDMTQHDTYDQSINLGVFNRQVAHPKHVPASPFLGASGDAWDCPKVTQSQH